MERPQNENFVFQQKLFFLCFLGGEKAKESVILFFFFLGGGGGGKNAKEGEIDFPTTYLWWSTFWVTFKGALL